MARVKRSSHSSTPNAATPQARASSARLPRQSARVRRSAVSITEPGPVEDEVPESAVVSLHVREKAPVGTPRCARIEDDLGARCDSRARSPARRRPRMRSLQRPARALGAARTRRQRWCQSAPRTPRSPQLLDPRRSPTESVAEGASVQPESRAAHAGQNARVTRGDARCG
jgi:hypothetical protein